MNKNQKDRVNRLKREEADKIDRKLAKHRTEHILAEKLKEYVEITGEDPAKVTASIQVGSNKYNSSQMQGTSHIRSHTNRAMIKNLKQPCPYFYVDIDESNLSVTDKWVHFSMAKLMDYGNTVCASIQEIAKKSGVTKKTAIKSVNNLLDRKCFISLFEEAKGTYPATYLICPLYYSMGTAKDMKECIENWNKYIQKEMDNPAGKYIPPSSDPKKWPKHMEVVNDPNSPF